MKRSGSSSSFILHHSSFAVRTPTATVTDLGTEFGVEVSKDGRHHVARLPRFGQAATGYGDKDTDRRRPNLARERIGPRGESACRSQWPHASYDNQGRPPSLSASCARFPSKPSRRSTWSTWWPAATASPAGGTGASMSTNGRPTDKQPPSDDFDSCRRRQVSSCRGDCRLWMAFSFPTAGPAECRSIPPVMSSRGFPRAPP